MPNQHTLRGPHLARLHACRDARTGGQQQSICRAMRLYRGPERLLEGQSLWPTLLDDGGLTHCACQICFKPQRWRIRVQRQPHLAHESLDAPEFSTHRGLHPMRHVVYADPVAVCQKQRSPGGANEPTADHRHVHCIQFGPPCHTHGGLDDVPQSAKANPSFIYHYIGVIIIDCTEPAPWKPKAVFLTIREESPSKSFAMPTMMLLQR